MGGTRGREIALAVAAAVVLAGLPVGDPGEASTAQDPVALVDRVLPPAEASEASPTARPWWKRKIDDLAAGHAMGISVREAGRFLYRRTDKKRRIPASNQKLLMAMALLDALGPDARLPTRAAAATVEGGVVKGNLWILGGGDPRVGPTKLGKLAGRIKDVGITRVEGSVKGSTRYFARGWWARGWKWYFPRDLIPLPSALTYEGNVARGKHVTDPELRAAERLTKKLRARGVTVTGSPGAGKPPAGLTVVARVVSARVSVLLEDVLRGSVNFHAEVLGKRLGLADLGVQGTIGKGADATRAWADARGVTLVARDSSGLSYDNRASPTGIVRLLGQAELASWGSALHDALPAGGQGTLKNRLSDVPVRAKTGTLQGISALSGWVWLEKLETWGEFSIISSGLSKSEAVRIENAVVRQLSARAR